MHRSELSENEEHIKYQLKRLVAQKGQGILNSLLSKLALFLTQFERPGARRPYPPDQEDPSTLEEHNIPPKRRMSERDKFRLQKGWEILAITKKVIVALRKEFKDFLDKRFKSQLRKIALFILNANKQRTMTEKVRYGITYDEKVVVVPHAFAPSSYIRTSYNMGENLPSAKGLRIAARILVKRRKLIQQKERERSQAYIEENKNAPIRYSSGPGGSIVPKKIESEGPRFKALRDEVISLRKDYNRLLQVISRRYPVLAHFGNLSQDIENLQNLAEHPPGKIAASIIGG